MISGFAFEDHITSIFDIKKNRFWFATLNLFQLIFLFEMPQNVYIHVAFSELLNFHWTLLSFVQYSPQTEWISLRVCWFVRTDTQYKTFYQSNATSWAQFQFEVLITLITFTIQLNLNLGKFCTVASLLQSKSFLFKSLLLNVLFNTAIITAWMGWWIWWMC